MSGINLVSSRFALVCIDGELFDAIVRTEAQTVCAEHGEFLREHATIAFWAAPDHERTGLMPDNASSEDRRNGIEAQPGGLGVDPRPAAVTFATTEHFTLQGARSSTIAESTGRATMFLSAVSGGLVALGLIATASRVGTAFYAFGLVLLPTLAFIGLVTFERVLQSGIEDRGYARRIAVLRGYYFDEAPELAPYLMSVPQQERLPALGVWSGRWQPFRTVAGMVAVITAVLAGAAIGLLAAVASGHSLAAALIAGGVVSGAVLGALMRYQRSSWARAVSAPLSFDVDDAESVRR